MKPNKQLIKETLQFEDLTPEEKEKRGILGRLYGPCASITIPTRNGRKYNEKLWDYQFANNEILKEMFANGGVPMELDHPADREETQSDKIAAMMPEMPKKDKDGHLITYVDIIDTPMGRIAYQLAKYGFKLGISSRGTGDLYTDEDGNESVDPETYDLTTFDLVLVPAVKDARLEMCESLDNNKTIFKQALTECLNQATEEDKKSLTEAINNLGITIKQDDNINIDNSDKTILTEQVEVSDTKSKEMLKSLQEAVVEKAKIEKEVKSLQEQLAVSNTKVSQLEEELKVYKQSTVRLTEKVQSLKKSTDETSKLLDESKTKQEKQVKILESRCSKLLESSKKQTNQITELNEQLTDKDKTIVSLNEQLESVKKSAQSDLNKLQEEFNNKINQEIKLKEQLEQTKQNLTKISTQAEKYKKAMNKVVERYIDSKATMLGVDANEIKNRLNESYTLSEIDRICENLQNYQLNIDKLPFELNKQMRVKVTESKRDSSGVLSQDDDIDEDLFKIAGLTK